MRRRFPGPGALFSEHLSYTWQLVPTPSGLADTTSRAGFASRRVVPCLHQYGPVLRHARHQPLVRNDPSLCRARTQSNSVMGIRKTYPWTSGGSRRHPAARLDVSTASVHIDRTRTEMEGSNPRRLDTLFKPRRLPGGDRTLFARHHKVRRLGAIGGYVGSGREFTLQLFFPSLLFRHNETVAYHPGGLGT
jgi:hypothetical protein